MQEKAAVEKNVVELIEFQSRQSRYAVGSRISSLRRRDRRAQKHLARLLDCSTTRISHFEWGKRSPSLAELERLAAYFKVNLLWLIHGLSTETCEMGDFIESMPPEKRRAGVSIAKGAIEKAMANAELHSDTSLSLPRKA